MVNWLPEWWIDGCNENSCDRKKNRCPIFYTLATWHFFLLNFLLCDQPIGQNWLAINLPRRKSTDHGPARIFKVANLIKLDLELSAFSGTQSSLFLSRCAGTRRRMYFLIGAVPDALSTLKIYNKRYSDYSATHYTSLLSLITDLVHSLLYVHQITPASAEATHLTSLQKRSYT